MHRSLTRYVGIATVALGCALSLPLTAHADDHGTPSWQLKRWDRWTDTRQQQVRQNIHADQRRDALLDHRQNYFQNQLAGIRSQEATIGNEIDDLHGHNRHDRKNRLEADEHQLHQEAGTDYWRLHRTQRADARDNRSEGSAWWRLHHFQDRDDALSKRFDNGPNS